MVTKDYQVSKIGPETLDFPVTKISRGISRDFTEGQDYEKLRTGNFRKSLKLTWYTVDNDQAKRLREMFTNPTFNPLYLSGIGLHDGLYAMKSAGSKRTGVPNLEEWTVQFEDAGQKLMLSWNEEELVTDCDTYEEWGVGAGDDPNWINDSGGVYSWTWGGSGDYYMECANGEQVHSDVSYLWQSDFDISVDHTKSTDAGYNFLILRAWDTGIIPDDCYYLLLHFASNYLSFWRRVGGVSVELRKWNKTLTALTWYNIRVQAIGDHFNIWHDGECLTEDEPLIDNKIPSGLYAMMDVNTTFGRFKNFVGKIGKPAHIAVSPGALELNKYYEARQVSSHGLNKLLVSPRQPITYDERSIFPYDPDCVLDLRFNEGDGTILKDHSGYGNDGTLTNGPLWTNDGYNKYTPMSLKFDGVNDYVRCSDDSSLSGLYQGTIEMICRLNKTPISGGRYVFFEKDIAGYGNDVKLGINVSNVANQKLEFNWNIASGSVDVSCAEAITFDNVGEWIHVTATWHYKNGLILYKNGSLIASDSTEGCYLDNAGNVNIGNNRSLGYPSEIDVALCRVCSGAKDASWVQQRFDQLTLNRTCQNEVRVFGVPQNSIADGYWEDLVLWARFNEGAGTVARDSSKNGFTGTLSGASGTPTWVDSVHPSFGKALDLEMSGGENQYISFGDQADFSFAGDVPFSVGCWFKCESLPGQMSLISKFNPGGGQREWNLHIDANDRISFVMSQIDDWSNRIGRIYLTALTAGIHYYVIATYDGSNTEAGINIYLNGIAVDNDSMSSGTYPGMTAGTAHLLVGCETGARYFDGIIDEPIIWKRELTPTEVAWFYNHAPRIMKEADWVRVPDVSHPFEKQWMVVENGQIRWHERGFGIYGNNDLLEVWNGYWDDIGKFSVDQSSSQVAIRDGNIILNTITRDSVEWEGRSIDVNYDYNPSRNIFDMRSGLPTIGVKTDYFGLSIHESGQYLCHRLYLNHIGHEHLSARFLATLDDTDLIGDAALGYLTSASFSSDISLIGFSPERNYLICTFPMSVQRSTTFPHGNQSASAFWLHGATADYDVNHLKSGLALIPFDTSGLSMDTNHYTSKGANVTISGDGGCANGYRFNIPDPHDTEGIDFSMGDSAQPGCYRVFCRTNITINVSTFRIGIWNQTDGAWEGYKDHNRNFEVWEWRYADVIIPQADFDAGDDFRIRIEGVTIGPDGILKIDQVLAVPISLANFQGPLNIAHAALNPVTLQRQGI